MAVSNPAKKLQVGGTCTRAISATSNEAANAICSAAFSGLTSTEIAACTQVMVTSTGATAAACTTLLITGIATGQVAGNALRFVFGVPAGAGVPATPLDLRFEPPLLSTAGGTIRAQMGALGTGHVTATINLNGEVYPAPRG